MLEKMTAPYRQRIDENLATILEIAQWLQEYPQCHPDMRKEKLELWRSLQKENDRMFELWGETRENWMRTRMNRAELVSDVIPEVLRNVARKDETNEGCSVRGTAPDRDRGDGR